MTKTKHKRESYKTLLAGIANDMAQPRVAESVQREADKRQTAKVGKPAP
jgi:hypothetical protein